ncbi:hypothetical protein [Listeria phage LP-KV022]|uniref:Uncharacterized protein n=5 Tax=Homburgvirus TaxID=1921125 RepID=A0A6C0QZZ7_9CAUD|nr:hypothetical protein P70_00105 [Listeria phage P70]YP_008240411.1 hypothetical protein LP110_047 [Listeria phage LP-110]YP_008240552.1 hypothetical protein LP037_074 [Listeria phage LP-037]AWY07740.1 hypothetical protein [Listeria phage LP-KV022]QHZ59435.1 hypothetical protein FK483_0092 [Listeria phage LP-018]AFQ96294.1 hypothetical protein P70_00105 [Listeria phage P70]AGI11550.1 hypothetical protein LP110_047 [Listeria phage LP-110]AGI11689.1 hypothetical protein LP037_074 [Listeria ph
MAKVFDTNKRYRITYEREEVVTIKILEKGIFRLEKIYQGNWGGGIAVASCEEFLNDLIATDYIAEG